MVDYGSDFQGVEDVTPDLAVVGGEEDATAMTECLTRRFDTTRGALHYDESHGLNISQFILDSTEPAVAEMLIVGEAKKDERVAKCLCRITVQKDGGWKVQINPQTEAGIEYQLVFLANPNKVALLSSGQV
jgi:hypothetical protein